jgi:hypothetical protein
VVGALVVVVVGALVVVVVTAVVVVVTASPPPQPAETRERASSTPSAGVYLIGWRRYPLRALVIQRRPSVLSSEG